MLPLPEPAGPVPAVVRWALLISCLLPWATSADAEQKKSNSASERATTKVEKRRPRRYPRRVPQRPASTLQLPVFGVAVDADGVLRMRRFADPMGRLLGRRIVTARAGLSPDVFRWSPLRKISLNRLEAGVRERLAAGKPLTPAMRHLAGLQRLQFVFFYPETKDIVVAGPAEGWLEDLAGRVVGAASGRPVLHLDDLLVALRMYPPGSEDNPFVGCTIGPGRDALARFARFQKTIPTSVRPAQREQVSRYVAQGTLRALGLAKIGVFHVSDRTNLAHVLIEADYRMKRIAVGTELPPVRMTTFVRNLRSPQGATLQRWWFTPHYECVRVAKDGWAMELVGQGVQLQTEDKLILPTGVVVPRHSGKSSKSAQAYARSFTKKFPEIAQASPVFAQLRNMIDLLVAAAFLRKQDYYGQAGWPMNTFLNKEQLPVDKRAKPQQVPCVVNVVWKGNRMISPAGGGVSILAHKALAKDRLLKDAEGLLSAEYHRGDERSAERWWWD